MTPRRIPSIMLPLLMVASACGTRDAHMPPVGVAMWPESPLPTRIQFLRSLPEAQVEQATGLLWLWRLIIGSEEGDDNDSGFGALHGIITDNEHVYVADTEAGVVWRLGPQDDERLALDCDEPLHLRTPVGVSTGPNGILFVADAEAGHVIAIDSEGHCTAVLGAKELQRPTDLAWDPRQQLLAVADAGRHQVLIMTHEGNILRVIGGRGTAMGQFNYPTHLAVWDGQVYVVDAMNFRVQWFDMLSGDWRGHLAEAGDTPGTLNKAKGIAVDSDGHIYVVDAIQGQVFIYDNRGQFLLAFGGPGRVGGLRMPTGITIDNRDRIYVVDSLAKRIQMYQYLSERWSP